jgi:hypothetical protein
MKTRSCGGADAVDAAVALYESHWVPWEVEVDDVARLLEVDALGKERRLR